MHLCWFAPCAFHCLLWLIVRPPLHLELDFEERIENDSKVLSIRSPNGFFSDLTLRNDSTYEFKVILRRECICYARIDSSGFFGFYRSEANDIRNCPNGIFRGGPASDLPTDVTIGPTVTPQIPTVGVQADDLTDEDDD